jgi:hypothetical protein
MKFLPLVLHLPVVLEIQNLLCCPEKCISKNFQYLKQSASPKMCIITYYYYYYKYSNFIIFILGTNFIYNISNEQLKRDKWFLNSPSKWNMLKGLKNIYDWYLILTFPTTIFFKRLQNIKCVGFYWCFQMMKYLTLHVDNSKQKNMADMWFPGNPKYGKYFFIWKLILSKIRIWNNFF